MRVCKHGYANPRLRLGFALLSRILPAPLVFISGYANTENVFYCLNSIQPSNRLRQENKKGNILVRLVKHEN